MSADLRSAVVLLTLATTMTTGCAGTLPILEPTSTPQPIYASNKSHAVHTYGRGDEVALGGFYLTFGLGVLATGAVLTGCAIGDEDSASPRTREDGKKLMPLGVATAAAGALFTSLAIAMLAPPKPPRKASTDVSE